MALTALEKVYLASRKQYTKGLYLAALPPIKIWTARINGGVSKGTTSIPFDTGASGGGPNLSFTDIEALQTVWVGSNAGNKDIGRLRVKAVSSGDGGITGTLTVAAHSYDLADDLYLTFLHTYELHPRWSYIDSNEIYYKDRDITYAASGNANEQPNPRCIAGSHQAKFINTTTGYAQFDFDLSAESYAVAQGASVSSYSVAVVPNVGVTTSIIAGAGYVRCTNPGYYWVKFGCTDSNGKTQYTYRLMVAHSNDKTSAYYPLTNFTVESLAGSWSEGGWKMSLQFYDESSFDHMYDGTILILWGDFLYWNPTNQVYDEVNISTLPVWNSNIIFCGYMLTQEITSSLEDDVHTTVIEAGTIDALLRNIYSYSWPLEGQTTVDEWWKYALWLTVGRGANFLLEWHSTAPYIVDIVNFNWDNTIYRRYIEFDGANLYEQINNITEVAGIRSKVVCDQGGRLHLVENVNLMNDTERAALPTFVEIEDAMLGESAIEIVRRSQELVALVFTSGFEHDGTETDPSPVYAKAPGDIPSGGADPLDIERQTFVNQQDANDTAGRFWSVENNLYGDVRVPMHGNWYGAADITLQEWWVLELTGDETDRGLNWTGGKNLIPRVVEHTFLYEGERFTGVIYTDITFEVEGLPMEGIPWFYPEDLPDTSGIPDPIGDSGSINGALWTAGSVEHLPPNSDSWEQRSAESTLDMDIDPYWFTKQASSDPDDAILWRCGAGYIKRSTDGGQTWSTLSPGTPPNEFSDSPAPAAGTVTYNILQCSSEDMLHVFTARWENAGGTWRSWTIKTEDDGTSFTWTQVE